MYFFYISSIFLLGAAAVGAGILLVRRILKKDTKGIRLFTLLTLGAGVIDFILAASWRNISSGRLMLVPAVLTAVFLLLRGIVKKHRGQSGRRCMIGAAVIAAVTVCLFIGMEAVQTVFAFGKNIIGEDFEVSIQTEYDFEVTDGTEPLTVVTSTGCEETSGGVIRPYRMVYDSCDLHYVLDRCEATAEDCLEALEANEAISPNYQAYFSDFIRRIEEIYPDADLSVLCENLKTLKVEELNQIDYFSKSLSFDSYGCYMRTENTIYIPKGTEYKEGEWGFQVLLHEFCHAARTRWVEYEDGKDKIQFCSANENCLLEESMNSAFSCGLLSYYERNIAYQVPSNYLRIMLECMDNYTLDDYINHSDLYFLSCLDEYTGYTNYAQTIWKLITLQRSDWEDEDTDIAPEEYEPIYAYLCDMYYGKYITDDMTGEERRAVADELVDKAFYDAPDGYKINPDYFYEYLEK